MFSIIQKRVTVAAGAIASENWDFDIKVGDVLPTVQDVVCLTDLSSVIGKTKVSLEHNSKKIKFLDEVDPYGISSAFNEKHKIDYEGARYTYKIENNHSAELEFIFQFRLEYPY